MFIDICIKNELKNIIFSSTASVYGKARIKKNFLELDRLKPINPYAKSKLKVEKFLIKKSKEKKINYMLLRYFNVAGSDKKLRCGFNVNKGYNLILNLYYL